MGCAKNYKTASTFVKVIQRKLLDSFFSGHAVMFYVYLYLYLFLLMILINKDYHYYAFRALAKGQTGTSAKYFMRYVCVAICRIPTAVIADIDLDRISRSHKSR